MALRVVDAFGGARKSKEGEEGVHALSWAEFGFLLGARELNEVTALPRWLKGSRLVAQLQAFTLKGLGSLASVDGLSGCAALQTLEFIGWDDRRAPMDKLASMPDLSSLVGLEVKGLPSQLQAWEDRGRKRFP